MADINIEKKSSSIWPWLLGLLLLAAVAFAAWTFLRTDADTDLGAEEEAVQTDPYQTPAEPPPATTTTGL